MLLPQFITKLCLFLYICHNPTVVRFNKVWNKFPVLTLLTHIFSNALVVTLFTYSWCSCHVVSCPQYSSTRKFILTIHLAVSRCFDMKEDFYIWWWHRWHDFVGVLNIFKNDPSTRLPCVTNHKREMTLMWIGHDGEVDMMPMSSIVRSPICCNIDVVFLLKISLVFCSMFSSSFTNFKQVMKPLQTPLNKTPSKAPGERKSCFQFSMLNIYHPYGCHLKGKAIMWLVIINKVW
jgi:hypothetical protein